MAASLAWTIALQSWPRKFHPPSKLKTAILKIFVENLSTEVLLADWGYDTNKILVSAASAEMEAVILPKKNRGEQREYDKCLSKLRHLAENCFLALKPWRDIAIPYAKFLAAAQVHCIAVCA